MSILDDKKNKSPDLDWFAFETRIRKVLHELLEPTAERSVKTKETVEEVKSQNEFLTRKIEELEFILHKSHKRSTLFDNINKRLIESDAERKMLEVQMKNDVENLHSENGVIKDRINIMDKEVANLLSRINDYTAEVNTFGNTVDALKVETKKHANEIKINIEHQIDSVQTKLNLFYDWEKKIDSQISSHREGLNRHDTSIEKALHMCHKAENILSKECLKYPDFK